MNCFGGCCGPCWPGCGAPCGPCGSCTPCRQQVFSPPYAQPSCPRQQSPQYCQAPCDSYCGYKQQAPCPQPCQQQSCYSSYPSYGQPSAPSRSDQPQPSAPQPTPICYEAPLY